MNQSAYFNLKDILVNELIGDPWLFLFVGLIITFFLAIKFKIPNEVQIMFGIFFATIAFSISFSELRIIWAGILLGVGFLFYFMYARSAKR